MGKTVESYRIALEQEINRWNGYARALRKDDREAFKEGWTRQEFHFRMSWRE